VDEADTSIPEDARRAVEDGETLYRSFDVEIERGEDEEAPIVMRFSDGDTTDAHGTRFDMSGADLERFRKNPVVRWAHGKDTQGRVPIARATSISTQNGDLVAQLKFDQEDDFARKIESKLRRGFINAGSIAASPMAQPQMRTIDGEEIIAFPEWQLRGLSIVDIPSNPNATAVSRDEEEIRLDRLEQQMERLLDEIRASRQEAEQKQSDKCDSDLSDSITRDEVTTAVTRAVEHYQQKRQERSEEIRTRIERATKHVLGKA